MTSTDKPDPPAISPDMQRSVDPPPGGSVPAAARSDGRSIRVAVAAALDRKAEELLVLDLAKISDFTDHFLICSGSNERQVQAIADNVIAKLRDEGVRPLHVEGLTHGRWVLLDYGGDLVIHIFRTETREFYALERLWSDAPDVTEHFVQ